MRKKIGIEIPDQSTQEWTNFATNLLSEYESERLPVVKDKETGETFIKDRWRPILNSQGRQLGYKDLEILKDGNGEIRTEERGIGSARLIGDIIIGGTTEGVDHNERNMDTYKELMALTLIKWQISKIEQSIIQEEKLGIEIPNKSTQEWTNFATSLRRVYEKHHLHSPASRRALEDYLGGGIDIEASWNKIRKSNEYKELMTWVLRSRRDHNNVE